MCWNVLSYGRRLENSWLYLGLKINLFHVPLHFGLIKKNFCLFFLKCLHVSFYSLHSFHLFLLFPSDMKSQHCLWCQCVSILTDRSVRNKILMLVSDEAKGEYRWQEENQRSERGVGRNIHNTATGENAESKDSFPAGPSPWSSKMCMSFWVSSRSFAIALVLAQESFQGAGAVVTCYFSPCLRLQQQQILLIEARIIGFPKAWTHSLSATLHKFRGCPKINCLLSCGSWSNCRCSR